jgi:hypothetical protein
VSSPPPGSGGKGPELGPAGTGAGVGTVLVLLASNLPDGSRAKDALLLATPVISVALSAVLQRSKRWYMRRRLDAEIKTGITEAKTTLRRRLRDQSLTDAERAELRQAMRDLELLEARWQIERIKGLQERREREWRED